MDDLHPCVNHTPTYYSLFPLSLSLFDDKDLASLPQPRRGLLIMVYLSAVLATLCVTMITVHAELTPADGAVTMCGDKSGTGCPSTIATCCHHNFSKTTWGCCPFPNAVCAHAFSCPSACPAKHLVSRLLPHPASNIHTFTVYCIHDVRYYTSKRTHYSH